MVREHLIFYGSFAGDAATSYGKRNDRKAISMFEKAYSPLRSQPSGLVSHPRESLLSASIDGTLTMEHSREAVLGVKCPYVCRSKTLQEASHCNRFCLAHMCRSLVLPSGHAVGEAVDETSDRTPNGSQLEELRRREEKGRRMNTDSPARLVRFRVS